MNKFDSENLSSAVFLDHEAQTVTIILLHKDHPRHSPLLLEMPFSINVLEDSTEYNEKQDVEATEICQKTIDLLME